MTPAQTPALDALMARWRAAMVYSSDKGYATALGSCARELQAVAATLAAEQRAREEEIAAWRAWAGAELDLEEASSDESMREALSVEINAQHSRAETAEAERDFYRRNYEALMATRMTEAESRATQLAQELATMTIHRNAFIDRAEKMEAERDKARAERNAYEREFNAELATSDGLRAQLATATAREAALVAALNGLRVEPSKVEGWPKDPACWCAFNVGMVLEHSPECRAIKAALDASADPQRMTTREKEEKNDN